MMIRGKSRDKDTRDSHFAAFAPVKTKFGTRAFATTGRENDFSDQNAQLGNSQSEVSLLHRIAIQPKLVVGPPDDKYEREADKVAEQVMRTAKSCPQCEVKSGEEDAFRAKPIAHQITYLQREDVGEATPKNQACGQTSQVCPRIESGFNSLRGSGQPLAKSERKFFESRFDHDFGQVRVHTGAKAAKLARALDSHAFTVGRDIVFGAGEYVPETTEGRELLAHELTHVVQQHAGAIKVQRRNDEVVECLRDNAQACLVHLHGDESEALSAAKDLYCGNCVSLVHLTNAPDGQNSNRCRLLRFEVSEGGQTTTCCVDPNRMFNDSLLGIDQHGQWTDASWRLHWNSWNSRNPRYRGCNCNPDSMCQTPRFIREVPVAIDPIKSQLRFALERCRTTSPPSVGPIAPNQAINPTVAFHGNLPDSSLNIRSYCVGSEHEATYGRRPADPQLIIRGRRVSFNAYCDARAYPDRIMNPYIGMPSKPKDFVLVTQSQDFDALVQQGRNVVLQSPNAPDDGSLSVFLRNGRYFNIEAQRGQPRTTQEQIGVGQSVLRHLGVRGSSIGCPPAQNHSLCPDCRSRQTSANPAISTSAPEQSQPSPARSIMETDEGEGKNAENIIQMSSRPGVENEQNGNAGNKETEEIEQVRDQRLAAASDVEADINSWTAGGQPLSENIRSLFEPQFNHDFGSVRIHAGSQASEYAQALGAQAFTIGQDIFFGSGQYAPGRTTGQRLLAHELTHVIQQGYASDSMSSLDNSDFGEDYATNSTGNESIQRKVIMSPDVDQPDEPEIAHPMAQNAVRNIRSRLNEHILIDMWGGDCRDNNKNGSVDSDDNSERNSNFGEHIGRTMNGFNTVDNWICPGEGGAQIITRDFRTSESVTYSVCARVVSEAYRGAGIPVPITNRVHDLVAFSKTMPITLHSGR